LGIISNQLWSPQPIGANQLTGVGIPSFVLYNRYESKIRSFFYIPPGGVTEGTTFNKAQIILDFNSYSGVNNESALFSNLQSPLKALDNFQKNLTATSPNFYNNGGNYWLFADYPVAYDPCTCDHSTWFKIDPVLLNIQDINLEITGGGTFIPIPIVSGSQPQSAPFSSVINNIENATSKGVKIAKSLKGFQTFIEDIVGVSDLINDHTQYNNLEESEKVKYDLSARKSFEFPSWTKDIPKFGIFLGIAEFLIGGGKSSGASSGPSSFEAKLKFNATGNITSPAPFEGIEMYTQNNGIT
jgi:hypothetical protein